jgi:hypothetical protein
VLTAKRGAHTHTTHHQDPSRARNPIIIFFFRLLSLICEVRGPAAILKLPNKQRISRSNRAPTHRKRLCACQVERNFFLINIWITLFHFQRTAPVSYAREPLERV